MLCLADLKMNRLLDSIDAWIGAQGHIEEDGTFARPSATIVPALPRLFLDLLAEGIRTVIWATGYRPDYTWLHVPVFDRKGGVRHDGGVVAAPNMYVLGLPFMRRRKSSFIDGVGADAHDLAAHICQALGQVARGCGLAAV